MTGDSKNIIEFQDVHKAFGSQRVLRGFDAHIPEGKLTFIIGRSGEGKSVMIKHIVGILRPDKGYVTIDGVSMADASEDDWRVARRKIGLLFQDGALFDSLTVAENVAFPLQEFTNLSITELNEEVRTLLETVGLPGIENKYPPELSIGEKKRVGLARALALKPRILLYDEPTTSMDPLVSELIDELIAGMQEKFKDVSSVVISHDVRSVLAIAEHIILLHEGRMYLEGPAETFRNSDDPLIRQFLSGSRDGPLCNMLA